MSRIDPQQLWDGIAQHETEAQDEGQLGGMPLLGSVPSYICLSVE